MRNEAMSRDPQRNMSQTGKAGAGKEPLQAAAAIPLEIRDVVSRVAVTLALTPDELMADLGRTAALGRRIAAALVVRRILLPARTTARLFGLAEFLVTDALATLNAVLAITQASATHTPLAPLVKSVVTEWRRFDESTRRRAPIAEVQATVARVFRVSVQDLASDRRAKDIVRPRHVAMYLAKLFTTNSLPAIARAFGGRHHTSVVHAVKKLAPLAAAVGSMLPPEATIEDWAQALRREMG